MRDTSAHVGLTSRGFVRLEAYGGARRDIQTKTASLVAVEGQGTVGFEEVVVRTHLDGPIACVANG